MVAAEMTRELAEELRKPGFPTMASLAPGLYDDVSPAMYHQRGELGLVSSTALRELARAPAAYRAWVDGEEREPSPAMLFGSALHCALLEPERYSADYAVVPSFGDCRRKENRAARDAWRKDNLGRTPIDFDDARTIEQMVAAVVRHPLAGRLLEGGRAELTARWNSPEGLACKARADLYREDLACIVDVKTTEDASPKGFARSVADFAYHVQASHYSEGFAAGGAPVESFVFLAIEKQPPYLCALYTLRDEDLAKGSRRALQLRRTLAECLAKGEWPGLPETITTIDLPPWAV